MMFGYECCSRKEENSDEVEVVEEVEEVDG